MKRMSYSRTIDSGYVAVAEESERICYILGRDSSFTLLDILPPQLPIYDMDDEGKKYRFKFQVWVEEV